MIYPAESNGVSKQENFTPNGQRNLTPCDRLAGLNDNSV